jgi:hypothetical protein
MLEHSMITSQSLFLLSAKTLANFLCRFYDRLARFPRRLSAAPALRALLRSAADENVG